MGKLKYCGLMHITTTTTTTATHYATHTHSLTLQHLFLGLCLSCQTRICG